MKILEIILKWLFSSDSSGIMTISTGLIAWLVYKTQVKLRRGEAAIVLLNEIRYAENSLKIITNNTFDVQNEMISILPTCSWDNNYQIFTHYLSGDDFKLLNDFLMDVMLLNWNLNSGVNILLLLEKKREGVFRLN